MRRKVSTWFQKEKEFKSAKETKGWTGQTNEKNQAGGLSQEEDDQRMECCRKVLGNERLKQ